MIDNFDKKLNTILQAGIKIEPMVVPDYTDKEIIKVFYCFYEVCNKIEVLRHPEKNNYLNTWGNAYLTLS